MAKVLRILTGATLVVVVAAGCGGGARPHSSAAREVPRALAREWEGRASAIATAAAAGNSCRALQLATSLRDDVVGSKQKVPRRLRSPLLTGVNNLADSITTCRPPPPTQPTPPKGPKPEPPKHHGPPGHDKGDEKGHDKGHHK